MANLKEARKEGREYLNKYPYRSYCYISYRKHLGFYHVEAFKTGKFTWDNRDGYEVFMLHKNGSLENILNTNYARNFHQELKRRKKKRRIKRRIK